MLRGHPWSLPARARAGGVWDWCRRRGLNGDASGSADGTGRSTAVDVAPSIAATVARATVLARARRVGPQHQAQVFNELAAARHRDLSRSTGVASPSAGFELQHGDDGVVRVVPRKKPAREQKSIEQGSTEAAVLAILTERPGMTEEELHRLFPRLRPAPSAPPPAGDLLTANTSRDTAYWWWPGKWLTYAQVLRGGHQHRFALLRDGRVEGARLPWLSGDAREEAARTLPMAPGTQQMQAQMEEERVRAVGQLLEQRAALRSQVRDLESQLRKLGMEVEAEVGGQSLLDMRKAEARELAWKALAVATVLVLLAAAAAAYAFHRATGVSSAREFRDWWRVFLREQHPHVYAAVSPVAKLLQASTPQVEDSALAQLAHNISASLAYGGMSDADAAARRGAAAPSAGAAVGAVGVASPASADTSARAVDGTKAAQ